MSNNKRELNSIPNKINENSSEKDSLDYTEEEEIYHSTKSPIISVLTNADIESSETIQEAKEIRAKTAEQMLYFRVVPKEDLYGTTIISPRDAQRLDLKEREIIIIEDPETKNCIYSIVSSSKNQADGYIYIDEDIITKNNLQNKVVQVRKYQNDVTILTDGILSIRSFEGEVYSAIADLRNDFYNLKSFLSNYVIYEGAVIKWYEKNVSITIADTLPETSKQFIGIFDFSQPTILTMKPEGPVQFNAILLMDVSKSMFGRDLEVKNIRPIIEKMKANFSTEKLDQFLKDFKEGNYIKRKSGAAFAALLFLNEKVRRGLDESVSIITFADEAEVLKANGKPYINSNIKSKEMMNRLVELIIENVEDKEGVGTNMASAVEKCLDVVKELPRQKRNNPLLIILLTDGFDTSMRVKEAVEQTFAERDNVVLYAVGIGPYVNRNELDEISKLYGGEVFLPENLEELSEWYKSLARVIPIQIKENIED